MRAPPGRKTGFYPRRKKKKLLPVVHRQKKEGPLFFPRRRKSDPDHHKEGGLSIASSERGTSYHQKKEVKQHKKDCRFPPKKSIPNPRKGGKTAIRTPLGKGGGSERRAALEL